MRVVNCARGVVIAPALLATALVAPCRAAMLREPPPAGQGGDAIPAGSVNLFRGAKCSADKTWSNRTPDLAVNGNRSSGDHWAGPPIPAAHTVDLGRPVEMNTIRMITYWNGRRAYRYHVECSTDGRDWRRIIDESKNSKAATAEGRIHEFDAVTARYVRSTFTHNSQNNSSGGHIVEIEGYRLDPDAPAAAPVATRGGPLHGTVGSVDVRYERDAHPSPRPKTEWSTVAWRGERVHGQFVVWTDAERKGLRHEVTDLRSLTGGRIPASNVEARFVRYTMGAGKLHGDILEPTNPIDIAAGSTRPVWLSVNVPADARPGTYSGMLTVSSADGASVRFALTVNVIPHVLPPPAEWSFHLDLWQHPWAVARVHGLEPWSPEHWAKLREVLTLAANSGQKCLTATMVDKPWGQQTRDAFGSMIKPTLKADGTWEYDYSLFDKYIPFGLECGIDRQINCYSMVPWGNNLYYQDEASGKYIKITAKPGTEKYEWYWAPLLKDFAAHLKEKGWFEKTTIAMDERHLEDMKRMIALVDRVAPGFKITLAANKNLESIIDRVHDYCFAIKFRPDKALNLRRAAAGKQTTYYVCCNPRRPNTFPFSPPAESTWLGWRAAAHRYTGFLMWALCSYTLDPFMTTDYPRRRWPTGDCYVIYPGPRSSIRFERLREGIQDYEKVRVLRETLESQGAGGKAGLAELERILEGIQNSDHTEVVNAAKAGLDELSRATDATGR
ncbi:MAG: glycoside hydrolase domain-containing protein [Planctomycetota bacterium]|jgi:hypothetical protein